VLIAESVTPVKDVMTWARRKATSDARCPSPFLVEELYGHLFGDRLNVVADAPDAAVRVAGV
jgi:hypothetical protein